MGDRALRPMLFLTTLTERLFNWQRLQARRSGWKQQWRSDVVVRTGCGCDLLSRLWAFHSGDLGFCLQEIIHGKIWTGTRVLIMRNARKDRVVSPLTYDTEHKLRGTET